MHKTPITLAGLANTLALTLASTLAAGAAQAQATMFGLIDLNITHTSAGSRAGGGSSVAMNDGTVNGLQGSRWGVRTTEDLGDGLKAGALLEMGLLADTGALGQGGRAFGRQVFVSLSSPQWGELRLGRQYILSDSVMGQGNPFGNALTLNPGTGVTIGGKALPFWLNAPRADNVLQLQSPTFGGFSAALQTTPESATTADRFHGVKLAYSAGALNTAASYEWNTSRSTGGSVNQSLTVGANYNLGLFKLLGGLQRNSHLALGSGNGAFTGGNLVVAGATPFTATDIDGWTLGAELPHGLWLFGLNYSQVRYSGAGQAQSLGKLAAGVRYALSKRSMLYASGSLATGDLRQDLAQQRVLQVGMRHAF